MSPSEVIPRDVPQLIAAIGVLWSLLQLVLARWRDLAPVTLAVAGCGLVIAAGSTYAIVAAVVAVVISGVAQARGARAGVGRPALTGLTLAAVALGVSLPVLAPFVAPDLDLERLRAVALVPCALAGALGGVVALERPGNRPQRSKWVGRIPVETGTPASTKPPKRQRSGAGSGQASGASEAHVASSGTRT